MKIEKQAQLKHLAVVQRLLSSVGSSVPRVEQFVWRFLKIIHKKNPAVKWVNCWFSVWHLLILVHKRPKPNFNISNCISFKVLVWFWVFLVCTIISSHHHDFGTSWQLNNCLPTYVAANTSQHAGSTCAHRVMSHRSLTCMSITVTPKKMVISLRSFNSFLVLSSNAFHMTPYFRSVRLKLKWDYNLPEPLKFQNAVPCISLKETFPTLGSPESLIVQHTVCLLGTRQSAGSPCAVHCWTPSVIVFSKEERGASPANGSA